MTKYSEVLQHLKKKKVNKNKIYIQKADYGVTVYSRQGKTSSLFLTY